MIIIIEKKNQKTLWLTNKQNSKCYIDNFWVLIPQYLGSYIRILQCHLDKSIAITSNTSLALKCYVANKPDQQIGWNAKTILLEKLLKCMFQLYT